RKQTVAWLLETTDALEIAAREISAMNPDGRGPRWNPHLTVGLRLPREMVPGYMRALDEVTPPRFKKLTAVQAGFWQPATQQATVLDGCSRGCRVMTRLSDNFVISVRIRHCVEVIE